MNDDRSIFGTLLPLRGGDTLFQANPEDWQLNACIEHWGDVDRAYIYGFRKAALRLTESMLEETTDQDAVVYPILYLYRHHIELRLKCIVRLSADFSDETISGNLRDL